eukprot:3050653-Amphidinium_carterae.1
MAAARACHPIHAIRHFNHMSADLGSVLIALVSWLLDTSQVVTCVAVMLTGTTSCAAGGAVIVGDEGGGS